jgi:hypothetical protein
MALPLKIASASVEDVLDKTILLIAAGGDASRFILKMNQQRFYPQKNTNLIIPMWLRNESIATFRLPHVQTTFLESILSFVRSSLGSNFPVAVVTGPNNNEIITSYLNSHDMMGLERIEIIEQGSSSVFTAEAIFCFGRTVRI